MYFLCGRELCFVFESGRMWRMLTWLFRKWSQMFALRGPFWPRVWFVYSRWLCSVQGGLVCFVRLMCRMSLHYWLSQRSVLQKWLYLVWRGILPGRRVVYTMRFCDSRVQKLQISRFMHRMCLWLLDDTRWHLQVSRRRKKLVYWRIDWFVQMQRWVLYDRQRMPNLRVYVAWVYILQFYVFQYGYCSLLSSQFFQSPLIFDMWNMHLRSFCGSRTGEQQRILFTLRL